MFSSSKDLEGAIGFAIIAVLLIVLLFFLKVPIVAYFQAFTGQPLVTSLVQTLNSFFLIAIGIDAAIVGVLRLLFQRLR